MSRETIVKKISLGNIAIGGNSPLLLIAGPCVIESEAATLRSAERLIEITAKIGMQLVFKASYDKANRTAVTSFRGPGMNEGLRILAKVKSNYSLRPMA